MSDNRRGLSAADFICNCYRVRRDDDRLGRAFLCREIEERGTDGARVRRFLCREIDDRSISGSDDF